MNTGKLIIIRHHESEWNKLGKWTGKQNVDITEYGEEKSYDMGHLITDIRIDAAFESVLVRTMETMTCVLNVCKVQNIPTTHAAELNERDYGDYTGKNKWEMKELLGEEEFNKLRREWDYPVPNGETLKMVYDRVVPYYLTSILPVLRQGKNVVVVSHGNTIRALIKYIENIPDDKIANVEMLFGSVLVYDVDSEGHMTNKEIRIAESKQKYLPEFVYGGIDGIVTTFAIIASAIGAALSPTIILILGFANLFADGFSMAASNYLSRKSEKIEDQNLKKPIHTALATFTSFIFVGFIPLAAFVFAPLSPVIDMYKFHISIVLTAVAFVIIGTVKGIVTRENPVLSAFETLLIGAVAAGIAYYVGVFLQGLV